MRLKVANKNFDFFNAVSVTLKHDAIGSAFSFKAYFDPDDADHKDLMRPLRYRSAVVEHNGEILLTGTLLTHKFQSESTKKLVSLGGYSKTGILQDVQAPLSVYPLQSDELTLKEIAEKFVRPFNIDIVIDSSVVSEMNEKYDTTDLKETQSIKDYLAELASQRGVILTHTNEGKLLFTKLNPSKKPIANFERAIPSTSMDLSVNGQGMHSSITALRQASIDGGNAGEATVSNPLVKATRPKIVSQSSGTDNDTSKVAKDVRAAQLENIALTIKTDRWVVNGEILKPNNIITVQNEDLFLYEKNKWFIQEVKLDGNEKQQVATLKCVLPETYNNAEPKDIFA